MKSLQTMTDKTAICLSLLCTVHCLVLPVAVVLLPSVAALPLVGEAFHLWMLIAVLPISAYALTMGCKKHKRYRLLTVGSMGLLILGTAAFLGHETLGEVWEKLLTAAGACILALGHIWNYQLCQHQDSCECSELHDHEFQNPELHKIASQ